MRKIQPHFLFLLAVLSAIIACKSTQQLSTTPDYEVRPDVRGTGTTGTTVFKVFSYGKSTEEAIERAKLDAIHAVLFKGIPGTNKPRPLIADPAMLTQKADYFKTFFGVEDLTNFTQAGGKLRYGLHNAPYRLYVQASNDGSIDPNDRLRVNNLYKIGVEVQVMHQKLREQLEADGIVKKFGL